MFFTEPTAEDSFALILARSRFGIAIAAMIRMIATTISNSINENPFCDRFIENDSVPVQPNPPNSPAMLIEWSQVSCGMEHTKGHSYDEKRCGSH